MFPWFTFMCGTPFGNGFAVADCPIFLCNDIGCVLFVLPFYFNQINARRCFSYKIRFVMLASVVLQVEFFFCRTKPFLNRLILFHDTGENEFGFAVELCFLEYSFFYTGKYNRLYVFVIRIKETGSSRICVQFLEVFSFMSNKFE